MRINKYLASCGAGSRRAVEELVTDGKVKVNGKTVTDLATDIDPDADSVFCDGKQMLPPAEHVYLLFHKPKGCVCTAKDDKGRKTVFDILGYSGRRLFTVGRLDYDTEGLLLMTDDGDLAQRLTHPSAEIGKTYTVRVPGTLLESELASLRNGVRLDDGHRTGKAHVKVLEQSGGETRLEITIYEGHNHQIKRMFKAVDKEVLFLKRTRIGELKLGSLDRGKARHLTTTEVHYLKNC